MFLESEAARSHVTLLLLVLALACEDSTRRFATASARTAADCALWAPSRRMGCVRPVRGWMLRAWRRPGKVVWVGTASKVARMSSVSSVVGFVAVVEGKKFWRAMRAACKATEVFCRVWAGVLPSGARPSMARSGRGRVCDRDFLAEDEIVRLVVFMRDLRIAIGAPIREARVWNVFVTSGVLEES